MRMIILRRRHVVVINELLFSIWRNFFSLRILVRNFSNHTLLWILFLEGTSRKKKGIFRRLKKIEFEVSLHHCSLQSRSRARCILLDRAFWSIVKVGSNSSCSSNKVVHASILNKHSRKRLFRTYRRPKRGLVFVIWATTYPLIAKCGTYLIWLPKYSNNSSANSASLSFGKVSAGTYANRREALNGDELRHWPFADSSTGPRMRVYVLVVPAAVTGKTAG